MNSKECKHLGFWESCRLNEKIANNEGWTQVCDYYPHCSDCPDFTQKAKMNER